MISEGPCDTKTKVTMLISQRCFPGIDYILKYIKIENVYFKLQ